MSCSRLREIWLGGAEAEVLSPGKETERGAAEVDEGEVEEADDDEDEDDDVNDDDDDLVVEEGMSIPSMAEEDR